MTADKTLTFAALQETLAAAADCTVVCLGDVMVDRFVYGDVGRVSPEAPIPVLARSHDLVMLGGTGNVACNVASLGGGARLVGLVGDDEEGRQAAHLAGQADRLAAFLVTDPARCTTLKTRFVAGGQQLLRVDAEDCRPAGPAVVDALLTALDGAGKGADVILLSDYGKGAVTDALAAACRRSGALVVVDSKAPDLNRFGEVDLIKPNAAELALSTGLPVTTDAEIEAALGAAMASCQARAILVTRGAKGASLARRGEGVRHFRGRPREVFDVSGAGDTMLAALGVALAARLALEPAIEFAMLAAGVAVAKAGTAVVRPEELIEALSAARHFEADAKIATPQHMVDQIAQWRATGQKIGFTNGCFDILHRGHIAYLTQARSWCDRLIVAVNSDRSVHALKGEGRPVNDLESRMAVLASLSCVDLVVTFDEDTPLRLIERARPDLLVKGADYAEADVVGGDLVRRWGGEVRLAALVDGYSTTKAIGRMRPKPAK